MEYHDTGMMIETYALARGYTTWLLLMNFIFKFKISELQIVFKTLPY